MKRIFISLLCMTAMICSSHAQIVGDMNNDGKLTIEDITTLTNTILGKTAQRTISANGTDQTTLIGSWAAQDGSTINIQSGGKATISKAAAVTNYEYFPSKGCLAFYNSSNNLVTAYQVAAFTSSCLLLGANGTANQYYPTDSYATSITMVVPTLNLLAGSTKGLSLVATPKGTHVYNATWNSSNTSVATVSKSGVVTAVAAGTATITARTVDGKTATCAVTVVKPVESVTLPYSTLKLATNTSFTIDAIVTPTDATNKTLAWTSSYPSIATVSDDGIVKTGTTAGSTIITAKTTDGSGVEGACMVRVIAATPTGLTLSKTTASLAPNGTLTLTATITPTSSLTVIWSSSDESIATVDQTGKVTAKQRGGTAKIIATIAGTSITKSCTVTVDDSNMYVNLGLPSGTLWATMNVGANSPEDYGNYYAWGETKAYGEEDTNNPYNYNYNSNSSYTKTYYNWTTYKWSGWSMFTLKKYNNDSAYGKVDNKTTLDLADDAAYTNWGANWRMPTLTEMIELKTCCKWTWTTDYRGSGKSGYIVYKVKDDADKGTVDKTTTASYSLDDTHIFLPAAGYRYDGKITENGSWGYYWTGSLNTNVTNTHKAYLLNFYSGFASHNFDTRCYGLNIRAVRNK